jgi:hypothetical protein
VKILALHHKKDLKNSFLLISSRTPREFSMEINGIFSINHMSKIIPNMFKQPIEDREVVSIGMELSGNFSLFTPFSFSSVLP